MLTACKNSDQTQTKKPSRPTVGGPNSYQPSGWTPGCSSPGPCGGWARSAPRHALAFCKSGWAAAPSSGRSCYFHSRQSARLPATLKAAAARVTAVFPEPQPPAAPTRKQVRKPSRGREGSSAGLFSGRRCLGERRPPSPGLPLKFLAGCCAYAQMPSTAAGCAGASQRRSLLVPSGGAEPASKVSGSRSLLLKLCPPPTTSLPALAPVPVQQPLRFPVVRSFPALRPAAVSFTSLAQERTGRFCPALQGRLADSRPHRDRRVSSAVPAPLACLLRPCRMRKEPAYRCAYFPGCSPHVPPGHHLGKT